MESKTSHFSTIGDLLNILKDKPYLFKNITFNWDKTQRKDGVYVKNKYNQWQKLTD